MSDLSPGGVLVAAIVPLLGGLVPMLVAVEAVDRAGVEAVAPSSHPRVPRPSSSGIGTAGRTGHGGGRRGAARAGGCRVGSVRAVGRRRPRAGRSHPRGA
ncbi:MAG: hypothetical protein AVDCRST_MAG49-1795 [uncultured Thermomicrobiales bacterium]|uniref:Uncharacterized protein n=1 Tax=uncultured Thermomicrobiales bacterium TaxID=1645740 RepID=A0A6J4UL89_9BACT|nr:MAG: hypothetical protein AVDCRST_MAG49-1795 [uncultured Thermomicrobiales bacterium]